MLIAFVAGCTDAMVGGGGLIQLPGLLINLPHTPLPTLLGTGKIAALSGTTISAYQYTKQIRFEPKLLITIILCALTSSYIGTILLTMLKPEMLKPLVLVILIMIVIYTYLNKNLGQSGGKEVSSQKQLFYGSILGLVVGFYDGFFGPGTGSFFVLGFVVLLGFEFIKASAYSKVVNCFTNLSSLIVLMRKGHFILGIAILLAVMNMLGSYTGSRIALKRGNELIRKVFLVVVCLMIARYAYDLYKEYIGFQ